MASYLSTQVSSKAIQMIGLSMGLEVETFSFALATQTINSGDTITLCQIPINSTVVMFYLANTATLGATQTWSIGDTSSTARYVTAGSTFGQAASVGIFANAVNNFVSGALPSVRYTAQSTSTIPAGITLNPTSTVADYLLMTAGVNAVAAGTGTLKGFMLYTLNTAS